MCGIRPNFQASLQRSPSSSRLTLSIFVPLLVVVSSDSLESPKSISLDDMDAEFALLEDIRKAEK